MARRVAFIDTLPAGSTVTLDDVFLAWIRIEAWNYELVSEEGAELSISPNEDGSRRDATYEVPDDRKVTVMVTLEDEAWLFGDDRVVAVREPRSPSGISFEAPKGRAHLRSHLSVS